MPHRTRNRKGKDQVHHRTRDLESKGQKGIFLITTCKSLVHATEVTVTFINWNEGGIKRKKSGEVCCILGIYREWEGRLQLRRRSKVKWVHLLLEMMQAEVTNMCIYLEMDQKPWRVVWACGEKPVISTTLVEAKGS